MQNPFVTSGYAGSAYFCGRSHWKVGAKELFRARS